MARQTKQKIREAYNRAASFYAESFYHELYHKPLDVKLLDLFCERVNPGLPLCELGCGPGEISAYLKYKGLEIVGVDISEEMIQCAKRLNPAILFQTGDVFNLDFPDNYFSGILAPFLFVNYGLDDIPDALKEIKRVMIPGAIFYLSFHAGSEHIDVEDFLVKQNSLEFIYLDVEKIVQIMEDCGFEVIESIVRYPYKDVEHQNKRAYIFARKV